MKQENRQEISLISIGLTLFVILVVFYRDYPLPLLDGFFWLRDSIIGNLLSNDHLGDLLQGAGVALLTILIPLSIALLQNFIEKKSEKTKDGFFVLELHMVLDFVLKIKSLLLWSFFIFIPPIFWEKSGEGMRAVELAIWFIGLVMLTRRIYFIYRWIKSVDFGFHLTYLKELAPTDDLVKVWSSAWLKKDLGGRDEKNLMDIFTEKIDQLVAKHE